MATIYDNVSLRQYNGVDWDTLKVVPSSHEHSGADITSGYVPVARLGSGTPSSSVFLRGDGSWQNPVPTNNIAGSTYMSEYSPVAGDMLMYGAYGWGTMTPQEWVAIGINSFQHISTLLATISSATTTTVTGLSNYKWLIVEIVASGIRETRLLRYVSAQSVQISAYIAGSWRYITLQTNSGNIVSSSLTGTPTVYVYGVK